MAQTKITKNDKSIGLHKIQPMEIMDLTNSIDEVSVIVKITKNIQTSESIREIQQQIIDSPWHEDDMAQAQIARKQKTPDIKDPVAEIRRVNQILGRR